MTSHLRLKPATSFLDAVLWHEPSLTVPLHCDLLRVHLFLVIVL
jgi:hypothetical protein